MRIRVILAAAALAAWAFGVAYLTTEVWRQFLKWIFTPR